MKVIIGWLVPNFDSESEVVFSSLRTLQSFIYT